MGASTPTVYGATWCPDCRRSKQFLGEHQIPCRWVDIETDPESEKLVIEKNQGKRIIPTIVFGNGSFLSEPTNADVSRKLGLKTKAARSHDDLSVVGAGPAGSGGWRFSRPRTWTGFTHTTGTGALERPRGANTAPKPS